MRAGSLIIKRENNMKKIILTLLFAVFFTNAVFAQDIFLSLTKYEANTEKLPSNITVITKDEIEEKNFSTFGELLQNEVGVNVRRNGTIGAVESVSIRGASSLQTLVLIDGRRINDIGMGGTDFTAIPAAAIERVEIIKGAGAAVYGTGAFGGVLNVITKKASQTSPLIDAKISYGSFNTFEPSLTIARSSERFNVLAALSNISTDGNRENSNFVNYDVFFSAQYKINEQSSLSLTENIYDSKYGVAGSLAWLTPKNKQKDKNKYAKLDYDLNFKNSCGLTVSAYASNNARYFYDATGNPYDPTWSLTEADYRYFSDTYGTLADFHYKDIFLFGAEYWSEYYKEDEVLTNYNSKRNRQNSAVYAQLNLSLGKFTIIPGVRYDDNSQYGGVATPSLSAVFNALKDLKFSANAGKVWRAPVFTELYWDQPAYSMYGDPDLKPEEGISGDVGVEYSKGKIKAAVSAFYISSKNLIAWDFNPLTWETKVKNLDESSQYGIELETGYIINSWLSNKLNYTYLNAQDEKTKNRLPYRAEHTINYTLTVKPARDLSVSALLCYKSEVFTNTANTDKLNGFITLDININYTANEYLSLWIKGVNIGDAKYELTAGYPTSGAAAYAGINVKFY